MVSLLHVVTVDNTPDKVKETIAILAKEVKEIVQLVHIANCENINGVKYVLSSLISPPEALICSGHWFEEEQEEIREIAQRLLPGIKLVMIPGNMNTATGDKAVVAFLKEQIEEWKGI